MNQPWPPETVTVAALFAGAVIVLWLAGFGVSLWLLHRERKPRPISPRYGALR